MTKINKSELVLGLVIVMVFLLVGFFTNVNTFSNRVRTSPSGFTDTGEVCVIDNVRYDVIVDNYSKVVYLMNSSNDTLTPLYDKNREPMTITEYNNR